VLLRLFAPFLPFVTEEVWSWWQEGSVHRAAWPTRREIESLVDDNSDAVRISDQHAYEWAAELLFEVRKQRSEAKQPMRVPITRLTIKAAADQIDLLPVVEADLKSALRVQAIESVVGEPRETVVHGYEAVAP
jgi:valyl-tRNA synthetase